MRGILVLEDRWNLGRGRTTDKRDEKAAWKQLLNGVQEIAKRQESESMFSVFYVMRQ